MEERVHPDAEGVESAFLKNARCRGLERTFLETTAAGRLASGDIVAICADPGMGKSQLAAAIMGHLSFDALDTISLSGLDEDLACIRLARASRRIAPNLRKGKSVGIIIDDIGPADEFGVERMDRTIVRLQKLGASIILTMRPEAEQILDGLERYIRIGKSDLMVREQEIVPSNRAEAIMRESEGIPELVDVLQSHASAFGAPDTFMPAFGETLSRIAKDSLRETLLDAERASRFAAMLLGHGTWDELRASVEGWHPDEAIAALREAVLVAVDHAAQTFRCVGLSDDIGFMYCSEMLRSEAAQWPSCAVAAASILIGRNEVRRAARIVEWLEPERRRAFELRYGLALLNAGETALVREAMSEPTYSEDVSPYALSTLSSAYDAIWLQEGTAKSVLEDRVFATAEDERDALRARLIARSRKLLHEASDGSALDPFERSDGMVSAFATHAEALALLEHGRVGDCRNLLRMRSPDDAGGSLGTALLAIDEEIANMLMCEGNQDDSLRMRRSEDFFERMGFTPLVGWGGILGSVRDTICGIVVPHGLDAATALAERRGNTVLAAALCCAVVLSDLLRRAPVSAHVKAQHAIALSERGCCGVLSDIAAILQAISANCIEEPAAYRKLLHRAWSCEQVGAVGDIVCAALSEDRKCASNIPVPYDFLWLAMAISNLPEAFSARFRSLLPPMWRKHLAELESAVRASASPCAAEDALVPESTNPPAVKGLEIRMLGEFSVLVDGVEIPTKDLVARGVGNVLALLAATPAHSLKRIELIDSVWPGIDYVTGRNRIYQAVSRMRFLAGKIDGDIDPVIQARNDGMIRFREEQVHCDIDDFVEASRIAMGKEGSEEETLAAVQRMERLYRGNLCIPSQDGMGLVRRRDHELRRLFIDAMVLGSEAALRVGKRRLAVHFAERAHSVDGMREDIACTLIRALKASGRQDEAIRNYRSFVKKASRTKGWRPSLELREAIGTLVIDGGSPPHSPARSA